ncbi:MAG: hypothetical protein HYZ44_15035 [Bacteroidetes bacterium]|nr:hypothetical protein [Bacteroidota bacterium]
MAQNDLIAKAVKESYFNLLAVLLEQENVKGSHVLCVLKWGIQLGINPADIDTIGKGFTSPYTPPGSELERLESVYHLVYMIYLDQVVEDNELEVANMYASRLGFKEKLVADLFKSIATAEFDHASPDNVRKEVIEFLKIQNS